MVPGELASKIKEGRSLSRLGIDGKIIAWPSLGPSGLYLILKESNSCSDVACGEEEGIRIPE